jgi:hypothetical protein
MSVKVKLSRVSSRGAQFRNLREGVPVHGDRWPEKLTITLLLRHHCAA